MERIAGRVEAKERRRPERWDSERQSCKPGRFTFGFSATLLKQEKVLPKILLANVQSVKPKIDELRLVADAYKPEIICLTETWLSPDIEDALVSLHHYSLVREDRQFRKGGGVAVYVQDDIPFHASQFCNKIDKSVEITLINLFSLQLFILCAYIPPNTSGEKLKRLHEQIVQSVDVSLSTHPNHDVIIVGDFNKFKTKLLADDLGMIDIVTKPTRENNTLDHVLVSNNVTKFYHEDCVTYNPPIGKSDHLTIVVTPMHYEKRWKLDGTRIVYDYRFSHLCKLMSKANLVNWNEICDIQDVNEQWKLLHSKISKLLEDSIPRKTVTMSSKDKTWLTPVTKILINEKWRAFRSKNWNTYNHLKEKVRKEIVKAKEKWAKKMKDTPYGLWKLTKALKKDPGLSHSIERLDAESLMKIITDSLMEENNEESNSPLPTEDSTWSVTFSEYEVFKLVQSLSHKKASGGDNIPNKIYSLLSPLIAGPLAAIYNRSAAQRSYPEEWKKGIVVPIPKTSPPQLDKMRLITLLPSPSKIMEKLLLRKCAALFTGIIGRNQHGFRKNASTSTALIEIHNALTACMDDLSYAAVVLISVDLSKAFDMVDHNTLLRKLSEQNAPSGMIQWLASYLSNRSAQVKISTATSDLIPVKRGVPQGSVLGPALFSIIASDFGRNSKNATYVLYADDANAILPIRAEQVGHIGQFINEEMNIVGQWCDANRQKINIEKCKAMIVSRAPVVLSQSIQVSLVQSLRILGVTLSSTLSWDEHVTAICRTASRRFHFLRIVKSITTKAELHEIYQATIRAPLEYCCPVFVHLNKKLSSKIERIDQRAHRLIFEQYDRNCSCSGSLERRRAIIACKLFRKAALFKEHILHNMIPSRLQRCQKYRNCFCRTVKRRSSFIPFTTLLINGDVSL